MTTFKDAKVGAAIWVKVTPKARKNAVAGILTDGTVKVQVTAPPEDGKANAAVKEVLAQALDLNVSQIEIVAGQSSERKLISLVGIAPAEVEAKLMAAPKPKAAKRGTAKKPAKTKAKRK